MKILVSGGNGQVGSEFLRLDLPEGIEIVALGRAELDITDSTSIDAAFYAHKPNLLINAAAYTAVDRAELEVEQAYAANEYGVSLLAEACLVADIPMFHISTDYVFDGTKELAYVEDDLVNPVSVYGKSKEAGERALRRKLQKHVVLRTSWIFGVHGPNFVKTMVRLARERPQLSVVSDQLGGPTSARFIAERLIALAIKLKIEGALPWGTYHASQQPFVSWFEFAESVVKRAYELGVIVREVEILPISSSEFPVKALRPKNSRLDSSALKKLTAYDDKGWPHDLDRVVEFYL